MELSVGTITGVAGGTSSEDDESPRSSISDCLHISEGSPAVVGVLIGNDCEVDDLTCSSITEFWWLEYSSNLCKSVELIAPNAPDKVGILALKNSRSCSVHLRHLMLSLRNQLFTVDLGTEGNRLFLICIKQ